MLPVTVYKRHYFELSLLVLFCLTILSLTSCEPKRQKYYSGTDILGTWYLNEWTSYHTLRFTDSTVFIDNHIDTIFLLNYSVDMDTLRMSPLYDNRQFANYIIKLTKDTVLLKGLIDTKEKRTYVRNKDDWKR
jgi:hypothetical protein